MPSRKIEDLEPATRALAERLILAAEQAGLSLLVYSTFRSFAEQQALYDQGRTKSGRIVTNAKPGSSFHNVRRALDVAIYHPENGTIDWKWMDSRAAAPDWLRLAEIGEEIGFSWGGRWKTPDRPHFENDYCPDCRVRVGPRSASHFDETGACKEIGATP